MADRNLVLQLLITAKNTAGDALDQIRTGINGIGSAVSESLAPLRSFGGLIAAALGLGSAKVLQENADAYIRLTNSLKTATKSEEEFKAALESVVSIAEQTNSDLETTASLYARVAQNAQAMNITQSQVVDLTELISKGMQLSGASAGEYASATLQLTQAFGSGVLRGEEFNAVMEASPELMRQLAKGLGVAVGELRGLAEQGVLTSGIVSQALLAQKDAIDAGYAKMTQTVEQAFTQLGNRVTLFVGKLSETTGASAGAANALKFLSQNLDVVAATMGGAVVASLAKTSTALIGYVQQSFAAAAATKAQAIATAEQERTAIASAAANVAAAQGVYNRALAEQRLTQQMIMAMEAELGYGVSETALAEAKAKGAAAAQAATVATQRYAAAQAALNALQVESAAASGLFARALGFLTGPGGLILLAVGAFAALLPMLRDNKTGTDELTASTDRYKESLAALNAVQLQARANELLTAINEQNKTMAEAKDKVDQLKTGHQNLWQVMRDGRPFAVQLTEAEAALAAEQQKLEQLQKNLRTTGDALNESRREGLEIDGKAMVQYVQQGLAMDTLAKRIDELAKNYKTVTDATQSRIAADLALAQAAGDLQRVEALTLEQAKEKAKAAQAQAGFDQSAAVAALAKVAALEKEYQGYQQISPVQAKVLIDAKADEEAKRAQAAASAALATQLQYQTEHTLKLHAGSLLLLEAMAKEADAATKTAAVKQAQIDAAIALAKAKGDEAKAAQLLSEKAALNSKDAQDEIARNKERVVELDKVINKLYAEAQLKGMTPEQQKYIQGLMDEANERKNTIATLESKLPLMEQERKQAEIMAGPIGELTRLYADQAKEHDRVGQASERYQNLQVQEAENALKLAQIKGDAQEIDKAQAALDNQKIEQAQALAATRQQEAIDAENAVAAKRLELAADGELTKADQEQIASMEAVAAAKRDSAKESQNAADQLGAETDAKRKAAEATRQAAEKEKNLKEETEKRESAGKAAAKTMNDALEVLRQTGGEMDKLTKRFYEQQGAMTKNAAGWDGWAAGTARAAQEVKQAYETQKGAVDGLLATLQQYNETGEWTAQVQQAMIQSAGDLSNQYDLLDQQTLDNLKGEVEAVNDKLREMQQEAQDAQDRIAELNAEIAAERGDTATADRLKLELEQRQALAEIDAKIREAEMQGNATLLAALEEQRRKLEELYALKERNLERDIRSRQEQERTSKSQNSSSGGSSGNSATVTSASSTGGGLSNRSNAFSLTVNTTGGIIDANFAEELARKLKPKLDEISRRSL